MMRLTFKELTKSSTSNLVRLASWLKVAIPSKTNEAEYRAKLIRAIQQEEKRI